MKTWFNLLLLLHNLRLLRLLRLHPRTLLLLLLQL
jgi:hypothetical protein